MEVGLDGDDIREPAPNIVSNDGRVIMFSIDRFLRDICAGSHCFICGIAPQEAIFNKEHIIPKWILQRYQTFNFSIVLPNGRDLPYRSATVPCCQTCNSFLGLTVETPISTLLNRDPADICRCMDPMQHALLFQWLCLLFVKIHLKHRTVRWHPNPLDGEEMIADSHNWGEFHHIFEVARAPYTGAEMMPGVVGSFHIFEVEEQRTEDQFDFLDMTDQKTIMLRLGKIGLVAVLDDGGLCSQMLSGILSKITGTVSSVQLREVAARFGLANDAIQNRPKFKTFYMRNPDLDEVSNPLLLADVPPLEFAPFANRRFGSLLHFALGEWVNNLEIDGLRDPDIVRSKIESGEVSFIFDSAGNFFGANAGFEAN